MLGFFLIFPLAQLFNALCLSLDKILFPGYRKVELERPVFIVGNPRSGTTFVHRLLATDEENFFCFRMWEIIFPAIIQKKFLSFLGRIDGLLGGFFYKIIHRCEKNILGDFLDKHPTGLFYPEEDEMLLIHIFSSMYLIFLFPLLDQTKRFGRFDEKLAPEDRQRIMTFYKECVKRQAYFRGKKRHFLSKNPAFSAKVNSLYENFPTCRIIYLVRNPLDVVPSMQSEFYATCLYSIPYTESGYFFREPVYNSALYNYSYPLGQLEDKPESSYMIMRFDDLVSQPKETIRSVYLKFDYNLSDDFLSILAEEDARSRTYKSSHFYSYEKFDLTKEQIISDFRDTFERFGFDRRE